jgi:hypothetical protein
MGRYDYSSARKSGGRRADKAKGPLLPVALPLAATAVAGLLTLKVIGAAEPSFITGKPRAEHKLAASNSPFGEDSFVRSFCDGWIDKLQGCRVDVELVLSETRSLRDRGHEDQIELDPQDSDRREVCRLAHDLLDAIAYARMDRAQAEAALNRIGRETRRIPG